MIIFLTISKDKRNAFKIVIFKKAKKTGLIQNKRYLRDYEINEIKPLNDVTTKCILTNTQYTLTSKLKEVYSIGMMGIAEFDDNMEIKYRKALTYENGLLEILLEKYMEIKHELSNELDVYQMNLIGGVK
ncbi:MAG: hypothetical protein ACTSQJ_06025 [Promethearchaeota archaeon]